MVAKLAVRAKRSRDLSNVFPPHPMDASRPVCLAVCQLILDQWNLQGGTRQPRSGCLILKRRNLGPNAPRKGDY